MLANRCMQFHQNLGNMKIHRILAISSFIIFFCPFFQTCSDRKIIEDPMMNGSPLARLVSRPETDEDRKNIVYEFLQARENMTLNGYEIGFRFFTDFSVMQLFIIPVLLNLLILLYAFKNNGKRIFYLSITNIAFCIAWLIWMYLSGSLEDIKQIKFGFYLFFINSIVIGYAAKLHTTHAKRSLPST